MTNNYSRISLFLSGEVQGIGLRPLLHRLAVKNTLSGFVKNSGVDVVCEIEGELCKLDYFFELFQQEIKEKSVQFNKTTMNIKNSKVFTIEPSSTTNEQRLKQFPHDAGLCDLCRRELFDPANRRYLYPLMGCHACGPRYAILNDIPYDRVFSSYQAFKPCPTCDGEYENINDRRYHSQNISCSKCGPTVSWLNHKGELITDDEKSVISAAVSGIEQGKIVAVKSASGFHLIVRADSASALNKLRNRKRRLNKPLAIMMPDIAMTAEFCEVSRQEEALLYSSARPIVLLKKREKHFLPLDQQIASGLSRLGILLPATAIHHLLCHSLNMPLVVSSANKPGSPVCFRNDEAIEDLQGIADYFLVHDLTIVNPQDDSIVMVVNGKNTLIRRARAYSSEVLNFPYNDKVVVSRGAHLKNSVGISYTNTVLVSPYIGDLDSLDSIRRHQLSLKKLFQQQAISTDIEVCDMHPDYQSTLLAEKSVLESKKPLVCVQHHYAHALACAYEHNIKDDYLAIVWDGNGYGDDASLWGGECLLINALSYQRKASLLPFALVGGDVAVKEPRRVALSLLLQIGDKVRAENFVEKSFNDFSLMQKKALLKSVSRAVLSSPSSVIQTSSMGRLLDAISSVLGIKQVNSYEGEAAMALQFFAEKSEDTNLMPYPFSIRVENDLLLIDWRPMLMNLLDDCKNKKSIASCAYRVHLTLVEWIVSLCRQLGSAFSVQPCLLVSGGCFQNSLLLELLESRMKKEKISWYWPQRFPANDGAIALGQLLGYSRSINNKR